VITWIANESPEGGPTFLNTRLFHRSGRALTAARQFEFPELGFDPRQSAVAMAGRGNFTVVWQMGTVDPDGGGQGPFSDREKGRALVCRLPTAVWQRVERCHTSAREACIAGASSMVAAAFADAQAQRSAERQALRLWLHERTFATSRPSHKEPGASAVRRRCSRQL
jgi:hypothetical protein